LKKATKPSDSVTILKMHVGVLLHSWWKWPVHIQSCDSVVIPFGGTCYVWWWIVACSPDEVLTAACKRMKVGIVTFQIKYIWTLQTFTETQCLICYVI